MIVLDTHVWLWMMSAPSFLSRQAVETIDSARSIVISSFSIWEIALLADRGRIRLGQSVDSWVRSALGEDARLREVPVDGRVATGAIDVRKRGLPGDPADQIILATAELLGAPLLTKDQRLLAFAPDVAIW